MENKIIKFLCIVVSLLCCGCSAAVNNKNNIIKDIVSFNNELDNNFLEYVEEQAKEIKDGKISVPNNEKELKEFNK